MTQEDGFKFSRPAPRGSWALEASAGTGKTWTIENVVADYLAKGDIAPDEVVIVTFTKMATAELKARIRANLSAIVREKATPEQGTYTPEEREVLRRALANFSNVRISTIHGFAQRTLALLGETIGSVDAGADSPEELESLLADTIRALPSTTQEMLGTETLSIDTLRKIASTVANNPGAELIASNPKIGPVRVEVMRAYERAVKARRAALGTASYSDLLTRLAERLEDPAMAAEAARSIKVLLVDEFQDTDQLQWEIFNRIAACGQLKAFGVVGDPKQAIYSFRGGDVQVYREAVPEGTAKFLKDNHRSTAGFVEGANKFFSEIDFGVSFGGTAGLEIPGEGTCLDAPIDYVEVDAAGRLAWADEGPSWVGWHLGKGSAAELRKTASRDLPRFLASLVGTMEIPTAEPNATRPLAYDDICILAQTNKFCGQLERSLARAGVPVTSFAGGNVFSSEAARQWMLLLESLRTPSRPTSAMLFSSTWFGHLSFSELADQRRKTGRDSEVWLTGKAELLLGWHDRFASGPRSAFFDRVLRESEVLEFLAARQDAARNITDLHHIAELLRKRRDDGLEELIEFLNAANPNSTDEETDVDGGTNAWSRRVDGDIPSVQIMTVHKAKGLQFPVVVVPVFSGSSSSNSPAVAYRLVGQDGSRRTVVDVTATKETLGQKVKSKLSKAELNRKLYVALTRAEVCNIVGIWDSSNRRQLQPAHRDLAWWIEASETPQFSIFEGPLPTFKAKDAIPAHGTLASVSVALDTPASRHSYSEMEKGFTLKAGGIRSSADVESEDSEGTMVTPEGDTEIEYAVIRGSAVLGKVVHHLLQMHAQGRLGEDLSQEVAAAASSCGLSLAAEPAPVGVPTVSLVLSLFNQALTGNLGEVAEGRSLSSFGPGSSLAEIGFDFAIGSAINLGQIVDVLKEHLGGDPVFSGWIDQLVLSNRVLKGVLTGSIDLVIATGESASPKFAVVDYKTNQLEHDDKPDYTKPSLMRSMSEHHYYLQALVYLVALHRYLRSRLGETYSYDEFVDGAAYLYVRGMSASVPGAGVIRLTPSGACIEALSDLFEGQVSHG